MKKMTNLARVLTTLRRQEPDMVPTFENQIDSQVKDKIKPGLSHADFIEYMDLDAITHHELEADTAVVIDESKGLVRDKWGALRRYIPASETVSMTVEAPVKSEKDLKKYVPPDPDVSGVYRNLEQSVKRFKGKRAVIAVVMNPGNAVKNYMLGQVEYFKAIKTSPDLVHRLTEIAHDYYLRFVKNCIDVGVDIVWIGGDIAMSTGPFLSPADTETFIMSSERGIVQYIRGRGVPCLRHTDGDIWQIFDMLVDVGYDAIHPIDPVAGMDLGEAKTKYGDRICLMGNVDCAHLLTWGNPDEVRKAVKKCIQHAGKGGGYICTTSNTVHVAVKPENYVAMVDAIREYGKYPL